MQSINREIKFHVASRRIESSANRLRYGIARRKPYSSHGAVNAIDKTVHDCVSRDGRGLRDAGHATPRNSRLMAPK